MDAASSFWKESARLRREYRRNAGFLQDAKYIPLRLKPAGAQTIICTQRTHICPLAGLRILMERKPEMSSRKEALRVRLVVNLSARNPAEIAAIGRIQSRMVPSSAPKVLDRP